MQWIHDPSQSNVDSLNNVRRDASRYFRNKKKAYLKAKIDENETNSKIKNIRDLCSGMNDKGDLVADSHSILGRWRNSFSQTLNVHGVNDVMRPLDGQYYCSIYCTIILLGFPRQCNIFAQ